MFRTRSLTPDVRAASAVHRFLVIALLVWVQVLGPFVHAHAGSAQTSGWHVHTALPVAAASLEAGAPAEEAWRQSPEGPDTPEIGVAAGLPQPRDSMASLPGSAADGGVPVLLAVCFGRISALALAPRLNGVTAEPAPRGTGRPGLPPLPHAPPVS